MEEKLNNLPNSYKENGANEVFIFGSIANGKFNENSDIDIAVKGIKGKRLL